MLTVNYDTIDDLASPYGVDEVLQRLVASRGRITLLPRWRDNTNLAWFMRFILKRAAFEASDADDTLQHGAYADDWKETSEAAQRAASSLGMFLKKMSGSGPAALTDGGEPAIARPLFSLLNFEGQEMKANLSSASRRDARVLLDAYALLVRYEQFAAGKKRGIKADRANPGKPGKAAFVLALAESWLMLTGRIPGKGAEENPFIRYVKAAWKDVGGPDSEDFVQATKRAIDDLSQRITGDGRCNYTPDWFRP